MAETIMLEATKREITGKQVKQLRNQGIIPGVLYGPAFDSLSLQMDRLALRSVLHEASGSHVIQINVGGEVHNALVRRVLRDPLRGDVLHVDFYRVRMDVVFRTDVRIVLVGDDAEIQKAGGEVIQEMNTVEIECLPGDLPAEIRIDLAPISAVGDSILASALPQLPGVAYNVDPNAIVAIIRALALPEPEEEEVEPEAPEPELIRRRPAEEEEEEE